MKLNKPIPACTEPVVVGSGGVRKAVGVPPAMGGPTKKVVGVTGTKFVGGATLVSTGVGAIELGGPGGRGGGDDNGQDVIDNPQDDIKPVGEEFIEVLFLWIIFIL
jgi:hypothetical protein